MTLDGTDRERVTLAAVAAAVGTARSHGLRVDEPVVLHDVFSVRVHLRPAPVVARVPTWVTRLRAGTDWIAREIDVVTHLDRQGVPVVPPSAELPPGPHERDGFTISYWTFAEPDRDHTATADDCAAMLPDLHAALRGYPGVLPPLGESALDLAGWLGRLDADDRGLGRETVDLLHAAAERLRPVLDAPERGPLHGDAHAGNLLATPRGLLWTDFEEVCEGPAEWDLATIGDPDAVRAHHSPDPDRFAACWQLRALQVALCLATLRDVFADVEGWDDGIRGALDALRPAG